MALVVGDAAVGGLVVEEAISVEGTGKGFGFHGPATFIQVVDYSGACDQETRACCPSVGQRLILALAATDSAGNSSPAAVPGRYALAGLSEAGPPGSLVAEAYYESGCSKQGSSSGQAGGAVILSRIDTATGALEGAFDLTLSCAGFSSCSSTDPRQIAGHFASARCGALNVNVSHPACP